MFTANKKMQDMLQTVVNSANNLVLDIIGDTHACRRVLTVDLIHPPSLDHFGTLTETAVPSRF